MRLRDFFSPESIGLNLGVQTKPDAIAAMVRLLGAEPNVSQTLCKLLERREQLGSTGVGRSIAIPHCRAPLVPEIRIAFGRVPEGLAYDAIDGQPVHNLFLIVAPPVEASNLYLPVLGRLAQFAKGAAIPMKLAALTKPEDFFALLDEYQA